jgi:hypothetical protein
VDGHFSRYEIVSTFSTRVMITDEATLAKIKMLYTK